MDVDLCAFFSECPRGTRVIEMDVRQENVLKITDLPAVFFQQRFQMGEGRGRPGFYQCHALRAFHDKYRDGLFQVEKPQVEYVNFHGANVIRAVDKC